MNRSGRDRILARLRVTPNSASVAATRPALLEEPYFAPLLDPRAGFEQACAANRTELVFASHDALGPHLTTLLQSSLPAEPDAADTFFLQDTPVLRSLAAHLPRDLQDRVHWSSQGPPRSADAAGVTLAEALVARTGSVLVSTRCGGRAASVLPPLHIVVATLDQLVAELDQALGAVFAHGDSMLCLITGPSRTSDIEKKLVLGAHGPRRLAILIEPYAGVAPFAPCAKPARKVSEIP